MNLRQIDDHEIIFLYWSSRMLFSMNPWICPDP